MVLRLLFLVSVVGCSDLISMGCARDSALSFCAKARAATTQTAEITEKDRKACGELRAEYVKVCAMSAQHKRDESEREFCTAFENICFRIPHDEPDQKTVPKAVMKELTPMSSESESTDRETTSTSTTERPKKKKGKHHIDIARFCRDFKNRYLFVCPDPFRFGQKAVVFCPIYSERCHVPLPDRPVVPTRKPPRGHRTSAVQRLCRSYRSFAQTYCNNPFFLSQQQYRQGCEKYWRFCTQRG